MIRIIPKHVRADGRAIVALVGAPADRSVNWVASSGTMHVLNDRTDAYGRACAILEPAGEGTVEIEVTYGAE